MTVAQLLFAFYLVEFAAAGRWRVLVSFVLDQPTPFLEETLAGVASAVSELSLTRLELFLLSAAHPQHLTARQTAFQLRQRFAELAVFERQHAPSADRSAAACDQWDCDFLFHVSSRVLIRRPRLLDRLSSFNVSLVAPFSSSSATLDRPSPSEGLSSAHSLRHVALIRADTLRSLAPNRTLDETVESIPDAQVLVSQSSDIVILNREEFITRMKQNRLTGELWQIFANPEAWEMRYIHPLYLQARRRGHFETPCPDVYWIPLFSETFCHDLRREMENFGLWSMGQAATSEERERDNRRVDVMLPYATIDIYLWQIDFNTEYMWILRKYLYPIQLQVYPQHVDYPYTEDNFVARYRLGEQVKLASHFDESRISFNVALSVHGEEYEGGGTSFTRYQCSVVRTRQGWGILHPNRPTHRHMGLELTWGTRYILVSFLDGQQYVAKNGDPPFDQALSL